MTGGRPKNLAAGASEAVGPQPRRGAVWRSAQVFPDEPTDFVVISCDDWNRREVGELLGLELAVGDGAGRYTPVIEVDSRRFKIYGEAIVRLPKQSLVRVAVLAAEVMHVIDRVLLRALFDHEARPRVPRPIQFPYPGQVRFAELDIPGEGEKLVVVVSTELFAIDSSTTSSSSAGSPATSPGSATTTSG